MLVSSVEYTIHTSLIIIIAPQTAGVLLTASNYHRLPTGHRRQREAQFRISFVSSNLDGLLQTAQQIYMVTGSSLCVSIGLISATTSLFRSNGPGTDINQDPSAELIKDCVSGPQIAGRCVVHSFGEVTSSQCIVATQVPAACKWT